MASTVSKRRRFLALVMAGGAASAVAHGMGKPIRVIVGFPAGGGSDILMRTLAQPMSQRLGQPVIVENRPGADDTIAADAVARSEADGTPLLLASNGPLMALPVVRGRPAVPYDAFSDVTPIGLMGGFTMVVAAAPGIPSKSYQDDARSKPGAGSGRQAQPLAAGHADRPRAGAAHHRVAPGRPVRPGNLPPTVLERTNKALRASLGAPEEDAADGRVGGGTAEVQRNILAERVLGLPPDLRADKGVPFDKIPRGKD